MTRQFAIPMRSPKEWPRLQSGFGRRVCDNDLGCQRALMFSEATGDAPLSPFAELQD
jgi:hypothetical protein